MLRCSGILLLMVAYIILIGHNIIPHHHHESTHEQSKHHHAEHDEHNNEGQNESGHLPAHFFHTDDAFTFTIINFTNRQVLPLVTLLPDAFFSEMVFIPPSRQKQPPEPLIIYISCDPLPSGLRGPPAAFS
jgi:hypothetical protein